MIALAYPTMRVVALVTRQGRLRRCLPPDSRRSPRSWWCTARSSFYACLLLARRQPDSGPGRVGVGHRRHGGDDHRRPVFHGAATVGCSAWATRSPISSGRWCSGVGLRRRTGAVWPQAFLPAMVATAVAVIAGGSALKSSPSHVCSPRCRGGLVGLCGGGVPVRAPAAAGPRPAASRTESYPRPRADRRRAGAVIRRTSSRSCWAGRPSSRVGPSAGAATAEEPPAAGSWCSACPMCRGPISAISRCRISTASSTRAGAGSRPRSTPHTTLADGYARWGGHPVGRSTETEGDGLMTDERFGTSTAGEAFTQRTGQQPRGDIVNSGSFPSPTPTSVFITTARSVPLPTRYVAAVSIWVWWPTPTARSPTPAVPTSTPPRVRRGSVRPCSDLWTPTARSPPGRSTQPVGRGSVGPVRRAPR